MADKTLEEMSKDELIKHASKKFKIKLRKKLTLPTLLSKVQELEEALAAKVAKKEKKKKDKEAKLNPKPESETETETPEEEKKDTVIDGADATVKVKVTKSTSTKAVVLDDDDTGIESDVPKNHELSKGTSNQRTSDVYRLGQSGLSLGEPRKATKEL